jgi:hypothetical protein
MSFPKLRTDFLQTFFGKKQGKSWDFTREFLGKKHGKNIVFLGFSWEKQWNSWEKHEKTWEHWKTLLVFLVFPVVRFSDIPWEVAHCFLTVSTKYSMVKKAAHGFSGGQIFPSEFTFTNWSDFP